MLSFNVKKNGKLYSFIKFDIEYNILFINKGRIMLFNF